MVRVPIRRVDPSLPLPVYATQGAAGFDFYCRDETVIEPRCLGLIPTNVVVQVPDGYVLLVALRSGTPRRKHLLSPHGFGIIDRDYCGPEDEIHVQVYNFGDQEVVIERGERVAQGMLLPAPLVEWDQFDAETVSRGGFGSTD